MSIFSQKNIFTTNTSQDIVSEYFTLIGEEDSTINDLPMRAVDDEKVYAKKIKRNDGSIKYMIRLDYAAKLYNPLSIYDKSDQSQGTEFLNSVCRSNKKFKEVNEKAFLWYIKFLNTKNTVWLLNAEREIL
jgi:hypothetical protein